MKRTNQSAAILALAALTLILTACSIVLKDTGDAGTVSITIGSSNARTAVPDWLEALGVPKLEDLVHTVQVLDASGVEQFRAENLKYGDTRSFSVAPGFYTFRAKAVYNDKQVAIGSAGRTIHSGANPAVIIQMGALPAEDTRAILTAGPAVNVAYDATSASVTFTGAAGLTLSAADFTANGPTISNVSVSGETATVTVGFAANTYNTAQVYTVSINANSTTIRGSATVTVTQAANPEGTEDTRAILTAGPAVNVAYNATSASVTFTGAAGLTLSAADFTANGATISDVSVSGGTVTVIVNFTVNSAPSSKSCTVSINASSTTIRGSATVTVTQAGIIAGTVVSYFVDHHGNLVTTLDGVVTVASGGTLTITAQEGTSYTNQQWYLNGADTGQRGETYIFSSTTTGSHTVVLFVVKDGKLYSAGITITVQ